jgi:uncharacterized membrane protein YjjP (DUF1212 family)
MLNLLSLIVGFVGLLMALPSFLPFLGWGNWFVIPVAIVGLALGVLSRHTSGRNLNLLVIIVAIVRLSLGGGIL